MATPANPWGLYDTLGNVHEWVANWHQTKPLPGGIILHPTGEAGSPFKTVCGGGFDSKLPGAKHREVYAPNFPYFKLGFRVLQEVDEPR